MLHLYPQDIKKGKVLKKKMMSQEKTSKKTNQSNDMGSHSDST